MFKNIFKRIQLKKLIFFGLALFAIVLVLRSFGLYEGMDVDVVVDDSNKPAAQGMSPGMPTMPPNFVPGPGMQMPPYFVPGQMHPGMQMPPNFVPGQMHPGMQMPSGMPSSATQRTNIPMT